MSLKMSAHSLDFVISGAAGHEVDLEIEELNGVGTQQEGNCYGCVASVSSASATTFSSSAGCFGSASTFGSYGGDA